MVRNNMAPFVAVLRSDERANGGGPDRSVGPGQPFDLVDRDAAHLGRSLRGPVGDAVDQTVESHRVPFDVVVVDQVVANQHVHHREHQRDVGPGQRLDALGPPRSR